MLSQQPPELLPQKEMYLGDGLGGKHRLTKCCGGGAAQWSSSAGAQVLENLDEFSRPVALCCPWPPCLTRSSALAEQWHF